jgi:hypothetical protein
VSVGSTDDSSKGNLVKCRPKLNLKGVQNARGDKRTVEPKDNNTFFYENGNENIILEVDFSCIKE